MAFENTNEDCLAILNLIREREDFIDYLKSCQNVVSIKHKADVNSIEASAVQRQAQDKYFHWCKLDNLFMECRAAPNFASSRAPDGPCLMCSKGNHWPRTCHYVSDNPVLS